MKNERTSKSVASIAGKVLDRLTSVKTGAIIAEYPHVMGKAWHKVCTIEELKSLAASALTQAPDKATARTKGPQPGEPVRTVKARRK